jgi:hypothetical protein
MHDGRHYPYLVPLKVSHDEGVGQALARALVHSACGPQVQELLTVLFKRLTPHTPLQPR